MLKVENTWADRTVPEAVFSKQNGNDLQMRRISSDETVPNRGGNSQPTECKPSAVPQTDANGCIFTQNMLYAHPLTEKLNPSKISTKQENQNAIVMSREEALVTLTEKTSYPILQENGQRRYGPPPDWKGPQPPRGCEVFIGKIPRDCFEDELVPIFETVGRIYMFRLMMDFSGCNRGYGFCIYTNREDTRRAVTELDSYEIRRGKTLGVCFSVDNCRLFVGGIPKTKTKDEIMAEMLKVTEGVKDVIVYPSVADKTKNRGFAFVEYENHKAAAMARRKLIPGRIHLWGHQIAVDWAEPEREVDEDVMSKVRILYVRNLMLHTTEEALKDHFNRSIGACDAVERVKKIRDYAFVHFRDRIQAAAALHQLDGTVFDGSQIEVTWAKPVDKADSMRLSRTANTNSNMPPVTNLCSLMPQMLGSYTRDDMNHTVNSLLTPNLQERAFKVPVSHVMPGPIPISYISPAFANPVPSVPIPAAYRTFPQFQNVNELAGMTTATSPQQFNSLTLVPQAATVPMTPSHLISGNLPVTDNPLYGNASTHSSTAAFRELDSIHDRELDGTAIELMKNKGHKPLDHNFLDRTKSINVDGSMWIGTGPLPKLRDIYPDAMQALIELCTKNNLGQPEITAQTHSFRDSLTNKQLTLYTTQLFLPGLNRCFTSPVPKLTIEEAATAIIGVTINWLISQKYNFGHPLGYKGTQSVQHLNSVSNDAENMNYFGDAESLNGTQLTPKRKLMSLPKTESGLQLSTVRMNKQSVLQSMLRTIHYNTENGKSVAADNGGSHQRPLIGTEINTMGQNVKVNFPYNISSAKSYTTDEHLDNISGELRFLRLNKRGPMTKPHDRQPYFPMPSGTNQSVKVDITKKHLSDIQLVKSNQFIMNKNDWTSRRPDHTMEQLTPCLQFPFISNAAQESRTFGGLQNLARQNPQNHSNFQFDKGTSINSAAYELLPGQTDKHNKQAIGTDSLTGFRVPEVTKSVHGLTENQQPMHTEWLNGTHLNSEFCDEENSSGIRSDQDATNLSSSYKNHLCNSRNGTFASEASCTTEGMKEWDCLFQLNIPSMNSSNVPGPNDMVTSAFSDSTHLDRMQNLVDKPDYNLY